MAAGHVSTGVVHHSSCPGGAPNRVASFHGSLPAWLSMPSAALCHVIGQECEQLGPVTTIGYCDQVMCNQVAPRCLQGPGSANRPSLNTSVQMLHTLPGDVRSCLLQAARLCSPTAGFLPKGGGVETGLFRPPLTGQPGVCDSLMEGGGAATGQRRAAPRPLPEQSELLQAMCHLRMQLACQQTIPRCKLPRRQCQNRLAAQDR